MTIVGLAVMAIALVAGTRWLLTRRRASQPRGLHLTQGQVERVIANHEREMQEDQA